MTKPSPSFAEIKATWFMMQDEFGRLQGACTTDKQRNTVLSQRDAARDAYYLALNKIFEESDAMVKQFTGELRQANKDMKAALKQMEDVVTVIAIVSEAIKISSALASMAV